MTWVETGHRVRWYNGPKYGLHRGEGVVQAVETFNDIVYAHVRWDDSGLDDEMVPAAELSVVQARMLAEQPDPTPNDLPQIADLVKADIDARRAKGVQTYGAALQPMNGRSALQDLYEELLDGAHYVRQRIEEENEHIVQLAGDPEAPARVAEISSLANGIAQNAPLTSAAHELAKGTLYLMQLFFAQGHELRKAIQALVQAEHPPADLEVAGYQYRIAGNGEEPIYDPDCYDQDWIDRWCANSGRDDDLVEGYYPEYRTVYGGAWRPVDPDKPPEPPVGAESAPPATETLASPERASETPRELVLPVQAVESLPYLIWRACDNSGYTRKRVSDLTGIPLSRVIQLSNYYVPVFDHEVARLAEIFDPSDEELERWTELAAHSRNQDGSPCPNPGCEHRPSQHVRNWGCKRCTCKMGRILDDPDLTESQVLR